MLNTDPMSQELPQTSGLKVQAQTEEENLDLKASRSQDTDPEYEEVYSELELEFERTRNSTPTNYDEWRRLIAAEAMPKPGIPTPQDWARMSPAEKADSRRARLRYQTTFGPIRTPTLKRISLEIRKVCRDNLIGGTGARTGVVISADPTLGKSTILYAVAREYELEMRRRYASLLPLDDAEFIPVSLNTMGSRYSIRDMNVAMLEFYGTPHGGRDPSTVIGRNLLREAKVCRTSLVIIDDIHLVRNGAKTQVDLNDHIKFLTTTIPATFVYAGVNVEGSGFFKGGAQQEQVTGRFVKFNIYRYQREQPASWREFLGLLKSLEANLCLVNQGRDDLLGLAEDIYDLTHGRIGAIVRLVRQAANRAIQDGTECVTQQILLSVPLDSQSTDHYEDLLRERRMRAEIERKLDSKTKSKVPRKAKPGNQAPRTTKNDSRAVAGRSDDNNSHGGDS